MSRGGVNGALCAFAGNSLGAWLREPNFWKLGFHTGDNCHVTTRKTAKEQKAQIIVQDPGESNLPGF
jgi:hypothetical protein